jgi:hypothetical protein
MDSRTSALKKHDLFELGWKALVAELGVANAVRFMMEVREGEGDYTALRRDLFAGKTVDDLCEDMLRERRVSKKAKPPRR